MSRGTAYEAALNTAVLAEIAQVDAAATAGVATPALWTAFVDTVKDVPGSSTVVTNLQAVTNTTTQASIATAVAAIPAPTTGKAAEKATAYLTAVQNAITTAVGAEAQLPVTQALAAINAATNGATMLTALETVNPADGVKTHAAVLGLDLADVAVADKADLAANFFTNKPTGTNGYTTLNVKNVFNNSVAWVKDETAPTVESAVYTAATGELVFTFSEALVSSATITDADITFGSVAAEGLGAVLSNDGLKLTITITPAEIADGFAVGQTVTITDLTDGTSSVTVTDDSLSENELVLPISKAITAPVAN